MNRSQSSSMSFWMGALGFFFSAGSWASTVYVYEVEHAADYSGPSDDGYVGYSSKTIARYFVHAGVVKDCVDLRELGSGGARTVDASVGFVLNRPLSRTEVAKLRAALCRDSLGDCDVKTKLRTFKSEELEIVAYLDRDRRADQSEEGRPQHVAKVGKTALLPRFSEGCRTGSHDDAWIRNASTPKSRAFLRERGFDLEEMRDFWMRDSVGEEVWTFGFLSPAGDE